MGVAALPASAGVIDSTSATAQPSSGSSAQQTFDSAKSFLSTVESWMNPGAQRDADREARAKWLTQAAIAGSVLAARIILAAPDNVASHEQPYYQTAAAAVQTASPTVWTAAVQQGGYWPVGAPFDMPNERAKILNELAALGASVSGSIPSGNNNNPTAVEDAAKRAGQDAVRQVANANGYQVIPTSTLLLIGAAVAVYLFMRKR